MKDLATEFNGKLARCLENGQYFDIDIKPIDNPKKFFVSLARKKLNTNPDADIGLNVLVDLYAERVAANSRLNSVWGNPSVRGCQSFRLVRDVTKMVIQISHNSFNISINGEDDFLFPHKQDLSELTAIQIGGDVTMITRMDHRQVFPSIWPPSSFIDYYAADLNFSNDIPIKFKPGHLMVFKARCYGQMDEFYFIFKHGHNETRALSLTSRFQRKEIVRSSFQTSPDNIFHYSYGNIRQSGGFPLDFNKTFKIGIAFRETEFAFAINGEYFCSYSYYDPVIGHNLQGKKPYTDVLSNLVGMKLFASGGMLVKVTEADHFQLNDPKCAHFEKFTTIECQCDGRQCAKGNNK